MVIQIGRFHPTPEVLYNRKIKTFVQNHDLKRARANIFATSMNN